MRALRSFVTLKCHTQLFLALLMWNINAVYFIGWQTSPTFETIVVLVDLS